MTSQTRTDASALKGGSVGTPHIVALVIACAAPVAGVVGLVPIGILLGNGAGMPGAILLVAVVLALFAVGFVRIVPHVRNTGAFYAYISRSLGAPAGVGAAYVLVVAYVASGCSVIAGFAYFGSSLLRTTTGIDVPWPVMGVIGAVLSTVLTVGGVALAARLLIVVLVLETIAMGVLDVGILAQIGVGQLTWASFAPSVVFSGSVGVALIYAFSCFVGFEGTAIYTEEAKAPHRTVARATFWVLGIVGAFYAFSAWMLVSGGGGLAVADQIGDSPGTFVFALADHYVGPAWAVVLEALVVVSLFAGMMAFQNSAGRYLFALSRDGVLPRAVGRVTRRRQTPMTGLIGVGVVYAAVCIVFGALNLDPLLTLATSMVGIGTIGIVVLITATSFAIAVFFLRRGPRSAATVVLPLVAGLLLAVCVVAGILNYGALTGSDSPWINSAGLIHVPAAIAGVIVALVVRRRRPEAYAQIGSTRV